MKKHHLIKKGIEKIKERGKEGQLKIKRIVIKRKDDYLTALEKNWRDFLMRPLTNLFYKINLTANHITYIGFVLIFGGIWMHFSNYDIKWQLIILTLAGISDAIDGPTARNNDNVTIKGTWLDHIRDMFLVAWATYLLYYYSLLSLEIIIVVWALQFLILWVTLKDFILRYLRNISDEETNTLIENFSLGDLQASVIGRLQFFFWALGYGFLLLALVLNTPILITIGHSLILIEILFSGLNLMEIYKKTS
jgi:phosphatidylglycerophosphate synthase